VSSLYARSVFFVADAERALGFYTERLGFSIVLTDLDANELFFWPPSDDWTGLEMPGLPVG
jgi:catechol 2,3-dioxygenase-like lactoylglutathione lyase family enzyme